MRARRTDANHTEIKNAFERLGCSVIDLSGVGKGCPDLIVATHGLNWLVEVKIEKGKRTPQQDKFAANWKGPHSIVRNLASVPVTVSMMRDRAIRFGMLFPVEK